MGSSTNILDLARRCEEATGPDRELDAAIEAALERWPEGWTRETFNPDVEVAFVPIEERLGRVRLTAAGIGYASWDAPAYSASLDAAMTLVPDDVRTILNIAEDEITTAIVGGIQGCADTPALALCAAALRARSTMTGEGG